MSDLYSANLIKFSEVLFDKRELSVAEWVSSYNSAESNPLKYILLKCIPHVAGLDPQTILMRIETDCPYERSDLLLQLLNKDRGNLGLIMEWVLTVLEREPYDCKNHCSCSLMKLSTNLINSDINWPLEANVKLFNLATKKCSLNCFLDFVIELIETEYNSYDYLLELLTFIDANFNPLNLEPLEDANHEPAFNTTSNTMLARKMYFAQITVLSQLGDNKLSMDYLKFRIFSIESNISSLISWSNHPVIDLFMEEDSMLLLGTYSWMKLLLWTNDSAAYDFMGSFLNSLNHDVGIFIEWLCEPISSDAALRVLLLYLRLPSIQLHATQMTKLFFDYLFSRIDSLWKKQLFPYDPSALLKYKEKIL